MPASLPLVHVTAVGRARDIVRTGRLETRRCRELGRELLYFFALKPAYGLKDGDDKSHQINRFPFVFVLAPEAVPNPYHVYPFDTGGALTGLFAGADPFVWFEDYELEPSHAAVTRYLSWMFGSVDAYYEGEIRPDILNGVEPYQTVTRGIVDIARMPATGSNRPDGRAAAIEVASSHNVGLQGHVRLAVIPKQYLQGDGNDPNAEFMELLKAQGIRWRTYDWQPNRSPNEYRDEIARIVKAFYDEPRQDGTA